MQTDTIRLPCPRFWISSSCLRETLHKACLTALHEICVQIFGHNFVADKGKIRRWAVGRNPPWCDTPLFSRRILPQTQLSGKYFYAVCSKVCRKGTCRCLHANSFRQISKKGYQLRSNRTRITAYSGNIEYAPGDRE